ncbi:unnamed protein product, partial [Coregonus sp. 'balchen']
RLQ